MGHITHEGMLIRHIDLHREAKLSDGRGARLAILIEHMDGTDYTLHVADKGETPEYLTALLAAVTRGADKMIRALDVLRAIGSKTAARQPGQTPRNTSQTMEKEETS